jgi:hypothetical protein
MGLSSGMEVLQTSVEHRARPPGLDLRGLLRDRGVPRPLGDQCGEVETDPLAWKPLRSQEALII